MKKTNYIGANKTNEAGKKYIEPIEPQAGILKAIAGKLRGKTGTSATCPYSLQHCWERKEKFMLLIFSSAAVLLYAPG